jgi:superfamily II DNA or RNA helicase
MKNFKDIKFPITSQYSSDSEHIPLEFYEDAIPKAKTMDMVLGYFSSNAIKTLCLGFSEFIYLGGSLRIVTNHQLTEEDKINLLTDVEVNNENRIIDIFQDLKLLKEELGPFGQHFFDCLKYLMKQNRLVILPVMHKPNAMAHYKKIILFDGENYLYVSGSANFTSAGIIKNGESFIVDKSWGGETEKQRIEQERKNFELIFDKKHTSYDYLNPEDVKGIIQHIGNDLTELELLEKAAKMINHFSHSVKIKKVIDRREIEFNILLEKNESKPSFPYPKERTIQKEAYKTWLDNDRKGIFAMATGSGKTITALNCVLKRYEKDGFYKAIIVVPTQALALQWEKEVKAFKFQNITSSHTNKDWKNSINRYTTRSIFNQKKDLILITTYATFNRKDIQSFLRDTKGVESFIYIADEAHNIGSKNTLKYLPEKIEQRIGLSATPERIYDELGSEKLYEFFNSRPPEYTFRYTMKQAIDDEILCHYDYFPCFVKLTTYEMQEYKDITNQLRIHIDSQTGKYKKEAEMLLLKRKRVVHKAENKKTVILNLLQELKNKKKLDYTFVFVPEGYEPDYKQNESYEIQEEDIHIIDEYAEMFKAQGYSYHKYLGGLEDAEKVLSDFANGDIQILLSMKCLDEGVDIPRAEHAIFCSSTGNPRQFVQRRGRVLRKSEGKEKATIWDLIVMPPDAEGEAVAIERNMFISEVKRVVNFAALADNQVDILYGELKSICERLGINLFDMIEKENEQY